MNITEVIMQVQKAALSIDEAAKFIGLKKSYLYRLVYSKKISCYKPTGGRLFFKQIELEQFLFRNKQGADYEEQSHA